jgi:hypothetical protein
VRSFRAVASLGEQREHGRGRRAVRHRRDPDRHGALQPGQLGPDAMAAAFDTYADAALPALTGRWS